MENLLDLLTKYKNKGVRINLDTSGVNLSIKGNLAGLTPADKDELRKNKEQLISFLTGQLSVEIEKTSLKVGERLPLAPNQKSVWVHSQFVENQTLYLIPAVYEFHIPDFDKDVFMKATELFIQEHQSLAFVFGEKDGMPYQEVKESKVSDHVFFETTIGDDTEEACQEYIDASMKISFAPQEKSPWSLTIFDCGNDNYTFFAKIHHLIADGTTLGLLVDGLIEAYKLVDAQKPYQYTGVRYHDYVRWITNRETQKRSKGFWKTYLQDYPDNLEFAYLPKVDGEYSTTEVYRQFDASFEERIEQFAKTHKVAVSHLFTFAFGVVLAKYGRSKDLIIGTPAEGRSNLELNQVIGDLVNTIPLRLQLDYTSSVIENLSTFGKGFLQVLDHQMYPLEFILDDINYQQKANQYPLFNTMVSFPNNQKLGTQKTGERKAVNDAALYDLTLSVLEFEDGTQLQLEFNSRKFTQVIAENLLEQISVVLQQILTSPQILLSEVNLLSNHQYDELIKKFPIEHQQYVSVVDTVLQYVTENPEAPAVIENGQKISYSELYDKACSVALKLKNKGVVSEDRILVELESNSDLLTAMLGIWIIGGIYIPIGSDLPEERKQNIKVDSNAKIVIDKKFLSELPDCSRIDHCNTSKSSAYILYTSGSTGNPKGVVISHRALALKMMDEAALLNLDQLTTLSLTSPTFDVSMLELVLPLTTGGTVVILDGKSNQSVYSQIIREQVTILQGTPTYFAHFESELDDTMANELNRTLKLLCIGGESLNEAIVKRLKSKLPDVRINNHYGPTEITIDALVKEDVTDFSINSIGKPFGSTGAIVVDDQDNILPEFVAGELLITGPSLATEYWNNIQQTAEKFSIFEKAGRMSYRTGDLVARVSEGEIVFLGRKDQQIKYKGYRIELEEINAHLRAIKGFTDAYTQVVSNTLVSWVISDRFEEQQTRKDLSAKLPDFMIPNIFVEVSEMPTVNGKVDSKKLIDELEIDSTEENVKPESTEEQQIVEIWGGLFESDAIHLNSNFYVLGGHSLKMLKLKSAYQKIFKVDVSLKELFLHTTPKGHLQAIKSSSFGINTIEKTPEYDAYLTTPFQDIVWYASLTDEGSRAYNVYSYTDLSEDVTLAKLKEVVSKIATTQDAFSTNFTLNDSGKIVQQISNRNPKEIEVKSLELDSDELDTLVQQEITQVFNLETDCLFRFYLVSLVNGNTYLLTVAHHIVCDTESLAIIENGIKNYLTEESLNFQENRFGLDYKDYSEWLNQQLNKGVYNDASSYWEKTLHGDLSRVNLADKNVESPNKTSGKALSFEMEASVIQKLNTSKTIAGASDFTLFLTAWKITLSKYSTQKDVLVGTPVSVRNRSELNNIVGYFLNTIPLRSELNSEDTFIEALSKINDNVIDALNYGDYPFLSILNDIDYQVISGQTPLFDVFFTYQHLDRLPDFESDGKYNRHSSVNTKFDFDINMMSIGNRVQCMIGYNADLYSDEHVSRIADSFQSLVKELSENPELVINQVLQRKQKERSQKQVQPQSIVSQFKSVSAKYSDKVAIRDVNRAFTYGELDDLTDRIAMTLKEKYELSKSDHVCVKMKHSTLVTVMFLAVKKLGAIYIPIDAETPDKRIEFIYEDSDCKLLIDQELADALMKSPGRKPLDKSPETSEDAVEFVIYTSGSTGKPKGVLLNQRSINNRFSWMWDAYPFTKGEVACSKTSISFVDHIWEIFGPLLKGIPTVYYAKENILDVESFIESLSDNKISRIVLVPSLLKALLLHAEKCYSKLRHLKLWICSGETLEMRTVVDFYEVFKRSDIRLLNIYGSTEVTADATYYDTSEKYNPYNRFSLFKSESGDYVNSYLNKLNSRNRLIHGGKEKLTNTAPFKNVAFNEVVPAEEYFSNLMMELDEGAINVSHKRFIGHMTGPMPPLFRELGKVVNELNQNLVKIETSGVLTFVERQVIGMFHKLIFNKSDEFYSDNVQNPDIGLGVATNGGTLSNITALNVALNQALKPTDNFSGLAKEGLVNALKNYGYSDVALLGSPWCHYSIEKSLKVLGLGLNSFQEIIYEGKNPSELKKEITERINALREKNVLVLGIIGVAGTTEGGRVEPLELLGNISKKHNIHFHVDAAFGGGFLVDPELKGKLDGIAMADSVTICAHKQFYLPVGLSYCLFNSTDLIRHFETNTDYQARKGSFDLGRYTLEGSRNFNSLYVHAAMSISGLSGYASLVRNNYANTTYFASLIDQDDAFELRSSPDLNILLYRYIPTTYKNNVDKNIDEINRINEEIQRQQFQKGETFVSFTKVMNHETGKKEVWFRCVMMNPFTSHNDILSVFNDQKSIIADIEGVELPFLPFENYGNVPIGKPLQNVDVFILGKDEREVPIGVKGEICVAGECVSLGYLNLNAETRERFVEFNDIRLFKTGDFGKQLPDGNIVYLGRKDRQININGFRIELNEIQKVSLQVVGVQDVVVTAEEQDGNKMLVCYLIGDNVSEAELSTYWNRMLPSYMVPSRIVKLEAFPMNASGKIDFQSLSKIGFDQEIEVSEFTELELKVKQIWESILKNELKRNDQDLFSVGGNSLIIGQLLYRYKKTFETELSVKELFEKRTIKEHAKLISRAEHKKDQAFVYAPLMEDYPLSINQSSLYPLAMQSQARNAYNMSYAVRVSTEIDSEIFEKALINLTSRHEILRTSLIYNSQKDEVRQLINSNVSTNEFFEKLDGDDRIFVDRLNAFEHKLDAKCLWRVFLSNENKSSLIGVNMHHLISDGWSMEVFVRDLFELYSSFSEGTSESKLPELPIQYKDFAYQQTEKDVGADLSYWMHQFESGIPILELPVKGTRPPIKTYRGKDASGYLDLNTVNVIRDIANQEETTLFVILMSLVQGFLYKYTGQTEMTIGAPISGRETEELENQIGFFVKTLPFKFNFEASSDIHQLVQNTREVVINGLDHSDFSLVELQRVLEHNTDLSRSPLFDVLLVVQNKMHAISNAKVSDQFELSPVAVENKSAKYDITFIFNETVDGIHFAFEYNSDLFEDSFMKEMIELFEGFARQFTSPGVRLNQQCLLNEPYLRRLNENSSNDCPLEIDQIGKALEHVLLENNERKAICFEDIELSYEELRNEVTNYTNSLRYKGYDENSTIAVCIERGSESVISMLAIFLMGACYVPVDLSLPLERVNYILENSMADVVIVDHSEQERIHGDFEQIGLNDLKATNIIGQLESTEVKQSKNSFLVYTSGSTGKPKAVAQSYRTLVNLMDWNLNHSGLPHQTRWLSYASFGFDLTIQDILYTILSGGTVCLASERLRVSFQPLKSWILQKEVEGLSLPYSVLKGFFEEFGKSELQGNKIHTISSTAEQLFISGGLREFLTDNPEVVIYNYYGPSETHIVTASKFCAKDELLPVRAHVGKALINTNLHVLDQDMNPVPFGVNGELFIGGFNVANGYLNNELLTNEKFISNPFDKDDILYVSGDVVKWTIEGNLEYVQRSDGQLKIRGNRVEIGEVESQINGLPKVDSAIVKFYQKNENVSGLVAYYISKEGCTTEELKTKIRKVLPDYMVPTWIYKLDSFPITVNGKIDKTKLPIPESIELEIEKVIIEPQTDIEFEVRDMWVDLLKSNKISMDDNFFERGGHSLLAVRMLNRIESKYEVQLEINSLYENPTIQNIAKQLEVLVWAKSETETEIDEENIENFTF